MGMRLKNRLATLFSTQSDTFAPLDAVLANKGNVNAFRKGGCAPIIDATSRWTSKDCTQNDLHSRNRERLHAGLQKFSMSKEVWKTNQIKQAPLRKELCMLANASPKHMTRPCLEGAHSFVEKQTNGKMMN